MPSRRVYVIFTVYAGFFIHVLRSCPKDRSGVEKTVIYTFLKAKLHRATVTDADLNYEGSVTIDRDLLDASGILIHERVEVYDVTNGSRFATYAIEGERGSGTICINGAAAHLCRPGDLVIICAYVGLTPTEAEKHVPRVLLLDEKNRVKKG